MCYGSASIVFRIGAKFILKYCAVPRDFCAGTHMSLEKMMEDKKLLGKHFPADEFTIINMLLWKGGRTDKSGSPIVLPTVHRDGEKYLCIIYEIRDTSL